MTFTVLLSGAANQPVSVSYETSDDTATAGEDYSGVSGSLTIPAGELSATLVVDILADEPMESPETFFVTLSAPVNADIADGQGIGTIIDAGDPTAVGLSRFAAEVDRAPQPDGGSRAPWMVLTLLALSLALSVWQRRAAHRRTG